LAGVGFPALYSIVEFRLSDPCERAGHAAMQQDGARISEHFVSGKPSEQKDISRISVR
jgi:hypothetical protein